MYIPQIFNTTEITDTKQNELTEKIVDTLWSEANYRTGSIVMPYIGPQVPSSYYTNIGLSSCNFHICNISEYIKI